jgi:hypothetical protein
MGNNQSTSQNNIHHKLAKPRTKANSAAAAVAPPPLVSRIDDPQTSPSSRRAYLSSSERQQIKSQLLSPLETDFDRASLEEDVNLALAEIATNAQRRYSTASCFGSRRNSDLKNKSLSGSRVSLALGRQDLDIDTAIAILDEVKGIASSEGLASLRESFYISVS